MLKKYNFKRKRRLCKKSSFRHVYNNGISYVDYAGILYVLKTDDDQLTKIAVAAGKRLGNAVIRNRIKRKMREVFRYEKSNIQNGYHIIWIAKKPLINASIVIFKKSFLKLCRKAGIIIKS